MKRKTFLGATLLTLVGLSRGKLPVETALAAPASSLTASGGFCVPFNYYQDFASFQFEHPVRSLERPRTI